MERADHLAYCERCTKRDFSPQKGVICSLTQKHADFINSCQHYTVDKEESILIDEKQERLKNEVVQHDSFGLSAFGIKNGATAGIIIIIIAFVWFFGAYFFFEHLFFFPPILLIVGIVMVYKASTKNKEKRPRQNKNDTLLDDF